LARPCTLLGWAQIACKWIAQSLDALTSIPL
jgi:hypothetical protein